MKQMKLRVALPGQRFGMLVVIEEAERIIRTVRRVRCQCDCGKESTVNVREVVSGDTTSCGCYRAWGRNNLTGQRFGRLVVLSYAGSSGPDCGATWTCRCDCGKETVTRANSLRTGHTRSCGCLLRQEQEGGLNKKASKHGANYRSRTPEYRAWWGMIQRCEYPATNDYDQYGGRGIKVCDRWRNSFAAFLEDMGPRPSSKRSVDRLDGDRGYEPGNCRWATDKEQGRNKRNNVLVQYQGSTKTLKEWAEIMGIHYITLYWRYRHGWTGDKLFSKPRAV